MTNFTASFGEGGHGKKKKNITVVCSAWRYSLSHNEACISLGAAAALKHSAVHQTVHLYIIMDSVTRGMRHYSQVECQVAAFHETRYLNLTSHAETHSICVSSSPAAAPCLFISNTMWCVINATQGHWATVGKKKTILEKSKNPVTHYCCYQLHQ